MDKQVINLYLKGIEEKIIEIEKRRKELNVFREPDAIKYTSQIRYAIKELKENQRDELINLNCILEATEEIRDYCIAHSRSMIDDYNLIIKANAWEIANWLEI